MELFEAIGARLRAERERLGKSQTELVDAAASAGARGSTRQSQSLYEKGERAPDAGYLAAVAAIGVDVRYVLTGARDYEPPAALTAEEQVLLDHYRSASREVRKAALGALIGARPSEGGFSQVFRGPVGQKIDGPVRQDGLTLNVGNTTKKSPGKPRK